MISAEGQGWQTYISHIYFKRLAWLGWICIGIAVNCGSYRFSFKFCILIIQQNVTHWWQQYEFTNFHLSDFMYWSFHNAINFLDDVHNFKIAFPSKFFHHICSSQPSMVQWLSSSIFPCVVVRSSHYGNTRQNLHFFNIYRHKSPILRKKKILTQYHLIPSSPS